MFYFSSSSNYLPDGSTCQKKDSAIHCHSLQQPAATYDQQMAREKQKEILPIICGSTFSVSITY
jgi:hypothetical protein